ncbi:MAG: GDYXXLXY domain-containing protein [Paludibacteraceae bacterium]|nr:GDYXXLXY domain-containing protein [Paludibacteraceae bacterium]
MSKLKLFIISANLLLVLGFFLVKIVQNEKVLSKGEIVLLELRPVDPRSLMQGDYMSLQFRLADSVKYEGKFVSNSLEEYVNSIVDDLEDSTIVENEDSTLVNDEDTAVMNDEDIIMEKPIVEAVPCYDENYNYLSCKYCVVRLDEDRVAHYVRLTNDKDRLEKGEMLLRYSLGKEEWRGRAVKFGTDSYFFQEGTGDKYANARYGMFKVVTEGGLIGTCNLIGLCGEDKQLIK